MIDNVFENHLSFLRWCLNDIELSNAPVQNGNWQDLLAFARKQAIVGVIWGGIKRLEVLRQITLTDEDVLEWMSAYHAIVMRNGYVYAKSSWVCRNFAREGFDACILKGQGNALMYPCPFERISGDIDVWVYPKGLSHGKLKERRRRILQYVRQVKPKVKMRYHHVDLPVLKDLPIEVHFMPISMNNPISNYKLQQWFDDRHEEQFTNKVKADALKFIEDVQGLQYNEEDLQIDFAMPTIEFNLVYQMCHILHHFFDDGIGLRQLIDYFYLLKQGVSEEDRETARHMFANLHISKFAGAVMYIEHQVLGLDSSYLVVEPDEKRGKVLLEEVLHGGNFGKQFRFNHFSMGGKYFAKVVRNLHHIDMCPSEALWEPWFRTWHFLWRLRHR